MFKQTNKTNLSLLVAKHLSRGFRFVLFSVALTGVFLYTRMGAPTRVEAATSSEINFQARLLGSTGVIVADGYYNVEFNLYSVSSGGTTLWTETYYDSNGVTAGNDNRLQVKTGYLSVHLGSLTSFPSTIPWDQDLYLTMNIGGTTQTATPTYDGEMTPRLKLTSVPYAFQAGRAEQLAKTIGGNLGQVLFPGTLGQATNYNLIDPGVASVNICLSSGNCAGQGGSVAGTGTQNRIAYWDQLSGTHLGDSYLLQSAGGVTIDNNKDLTVDTNTLFVDSANDRLGVGTITPSTKLDVTGLTLNTDANNAVGVQYNSFSLTKNDGNTRTFSGYSLQALINAGGSNANTTLNLINVDTTNTSATGVTTNLLRLGYGGSQKLLVDSSGATTIANTLTVSGGGASITGNTTVTSGTFTSSGGAIQLNVNSNNTTNINSGTSTGTITLGGGSSPFVLDSTNFDVSSTGVLSGITGLTMASGNFTQNGSGSFSTGTGAVSLNGNTAVTGTLSVTSTSSLVGALTIGNDAASPTTGQLIFHDSTGSNSFTTTLQTAALTTGSRTITIPNTAGVNDTVCLLTLTNCSGSVSSTGNANRIPVFTTDGNHLGDSYFLQSAGAVTLDANKNFVYAAGTGTFDQSASSGAFATGTGAVSLNGNVTIASGKTLSVAGLSTNGLVKTTGGTGTLAVATAGTDYEVPLTFNNGLTRSTNTVQLGGSFLQNTTLAAGNSFGLTLTSDLSGGARSTYPLIISQANDATNNSTAGLLQITNSDTGSIGATVPLVNLTQVPGGVGLNIGFSSGGGNTGIAVNGNNSTGAGYTAAGYGQGTGFVASFNSVTSTTSGKGFSANGTLSGALSAYTGSLFDGNFNRTLTGPSINDTGNFLNLVRSNTVNSGGNTFTVSGALANLQSNCTQTAGTCTDTSNILSLNQQYASASGAVLNIQDAGTGNLATLDATNASANGVSIDIQSSSSSQYAFQVTTNNGATNALSVKGDGSVDLSSLSAGGLVKAAVTTGRLSVAVAGTDYQVPLTFNNGITNTANTVQLGGNLVQNTTVGAGNGFGLTLTSDLSGGARSTYPLIISQANDATNNNTAGLLQISNSDTGSIGGSTSLINLSQVAGGTGIALTYAGSGTGVGMSINGTATGTGFSTIGFGSGTGYSANFNSTLTASGKGFAAGGTLSGALSAYTGSLFDGNFNRTLTGSSINDTGNFLNLTRANTINSGGNTFTVSGALANLQSNCTQTAGTCTDTANILSLNQQYANASGAALNIQGAGTGNLATLDATNASANGVSIDIQSSSSSQYAFQVTTNNGATNALSVKGDGSVDLSSLSAGGLVKAAVTTGRLSVAVAGTDYENPLTFDNGLTRTTNNVQLGGSFLQNTTLAAGNSYGLTLTSNLSGGARSTYPLIISQANDATNNNTAGLLQLVNNDTASIAAVLQVTQAATSSNAKAISIAAGGGDGITVTGVTSSATAYHSDVSAGIGLGLGSLTTGIGQNTGAAVTTGTGILFNTTGTVLTSGSALRAIGTASGALAAYTGNLIDISPTRTLTGATITDSGKLLNLARTNSVTSANTFTVQGAVASLSSTCSASGGGTCTDTSNILSLNQQYASASGTVLSIQNAGTGADINLGGGTITTSATTANVLNTTATTVNAFGAATNINLGSSSGFNLTPGGNLTIPLGNAKTTTITSDLSGGARSTAPLTISQANNASNDNSAGLLQITNSDTGSTGVGAALIGLTQVPGGYGLAVGFSAGGSNMGIRVNGSNSTGIGYSALGYGQGTAFSADFNSVSGVNSGKGFSAGGTLSGALSAYTGSLFDGNFNRTLTGTSINDTGTFLNLTRANTVNSGGNTFTVSGALATLQSTCTQTAGTCTDTSNILSLNQQYASASGAVLNISNSGTGNAILLNSGASIASAAGVNLSLVSGTTGSLNLDTGTTGAITIGNNANAKNITIGNTTGATALTLQSGTGNLSIITQGTGTLGVGNNAVAQNIVIGNTTGGTSLTLQAGSGNIILGSGTLQRTAVGTTTLNLIDGSNTTFALTNLGAGVANLTTDGSITAATGLTVSAGGAGITGNSTVTGTLGVTATNAAAFIIQGSDTVLTADTTARSGSGGNLVKVGNSTGTDTATTVLQLDGASADITSNLSALNGGLYYNSSGTPGFRGVVNGAVRTICDDSGNCNGAGTSLQTAYNNSTPSPEIKLDGTRGALTIQDADTTIGATVNLFEILNSNAAATLLKVQGNGNVGIGTSGNPAQLLSVGGTTGNFTVTSAGNTVVGGTLGVTSNSTLTGTLTVNNTSALNGAVTITGAANTVQLKIKANSTQTGANDLLQLTASNGTTIYSGFDTTGSLYFKDQVSGFTSTISVQDNSLSASNKILTLPNASGEICTSSGNCIGNGGSGDVFKNGQTGPLVIGTTDNTDFTLITNNTSRIYIKNDGKVGIGTNSTPSSLLSVGTGTGAFTVDTSGNIATTGTYNTNTLTSSQLVFGAASGASVSSANNQNLTLQTQGSGTLALNTGSGGILTTNAATIRRTAAGTTAIDLLDASADTILSVTNSDGTRVANLDVEGTITAGTGLTVTAGGATINGLLTANNGITLVAGQTLTVNTDAVTDLTGSGIVLSSGALTVDASSATGFFRNGGNSFGTTTKLGTNDAQDLIFRANNADRLTLTQTGDLTFAASNTISTSLTNGTLTVNSNGTGALTLDSGTTGAINIGNNANAKAITIGNSSGATQLVFNTGTGGLNLGSNGIANTIQIGNTTGAVAQTINIGNNATASSTSTVVIGSTVAGNITLQSAATIAIGNNAAAQTLNIGNTTGATALNLLTGTGNFSLDGVAGTTYAIGASTVGGTVSIGGANQTGTITLGQSTDTNTVNIGNATIANTKTGTVNIATSATGASGKTAVVIGSTNAASSVLIQGGTGNVQIQTQGGTLGIGNNAIAQTLAIGNSTGNTSVAISSGTGDLTLQTQGTGTLGIGNNAAAQTIAIGNTTGGTALNLLTGTGNFTLDGVAGTTYALGASTTTGTITIGGTAQTGAISLGTGAGAGNRAVTVGSTANASTLTLQSGTGNLSITTQGTGILGVGNNAVAQNIVVGNTTGATALTLQSGSAGIVVNGVLAATANSAALCRDTSTGKLTACDANATGSAFLQGGNTFGAAGDLGTNDNFALNFRTNGTTKLTVSTAGDLTFAQGANRTLNVAANATANGAGYDFTLAAGAADGTAAGDVGGVLALQGGAAAGSGNNNGGNITIDGGAKTGSGSIGNVILQGSGGNVGIGGTPTYKLDIQDNVNSVSRVSFRNSNAGSSAATVFNLGNDSSATAAALILNSSTNTSYGGANSLNLINVANAPLTLGAANGIAMTILGSGNVGIGDTTPLAALTVGNGDLFQVSSTGQALFNGVATDITTGNNEDLTIVANGSGVINLNDSVKVATLAAATANSAAVCRDTSTNTLTACDANATGTAFIQGGNTFGAAGDLGTNDNFALNFRTNGTTKLTVSTAGDLTFAQASTVSTSTGNLTIQANGTSTAAVDTSGAGTVNLGRTNAATVQIGNTANTTTLTLDAGTGSTVAIANSAHTHTVNLATGAAAQTVTIGSTNGSSSLVLQSGTGNLSITTQGTGTLGIGNNAVAQNIAIGNTTGGTGVTIATGTGNFTLDGVAGTTYSLGASTTTGTITIGGTAQTGAISLGTGAGAGNRAVTVGSTANASTLALQSGTGNLSITTQGTGILGVGNNAVAQTLQVGNATGATSVAIAAGTGDLTLQTQGTGTLGVGNNAVAQNIVVGNTTGATALTLQAGSAGIVVNGVLAATANSAAVCRDTSTGKLTACDANTTGRAFVQGGNTFGAAGDLGTNDAFALNIRTGGTTKLTVSTGGNLTFAQGANRTLNVAANSTANGAGYNLTFAAGAADGTAAGNVGGVLALQGGAAAGSGNNNGGNITIDGGAKTGSGTIGNIILQGSGGNVGIGTTPATGIKLDISGSSTDTAVQILSGNAANYAILNIGRTVIEGQFGVVAAINQLAAGTVAGDVVLRSTSGHLYVSAGTASGEIRFNTGAPGTTKVVIASGGNVGIGTTSPLAALDVNGGARFAGDLLQTGNAVNGLGDSGNSVPNSGFEINDDTLPTVADGWTVTVSFAGTTFATTTTAPAEGTRSQQIISTTTSGGAVVSSCFPIVGGRAYPLFARAKSDVATTDGLFLRLQTYTTKANCTALTSPTAYDPVSDGAVTTSYADYGGTVTPASTQLWAQVYVFNFLPNTNATFTVDAVRVGSGSTVTLQNAYALGNTITTTDARDLIITSADTATDSNIIVNLQCSTCSALGGQFQVRKSNSVFASFTPTGEFNLTNGAAGAASPTTVGTLKFDNMYDSTGNATANKIIFYDDGAAFKAGIGVSNGSLDIFSGGNHRFFINHVSEASPGTVALTLATTTGNATFVGDVAVNGGDITSSGSLNVTANTTGTLALDTSGAGTVTVGAGNATTVSVATGSTARTVAIGNTTSGTTVVISTGGGASALNIGDDANTKTIDIGGVTNSGTDTINIATNATAADVILMGSTHASSTTTLQGGAYSLVARNTGIGINTGATAPTGDLSFGYAASSRIIDVLTNTGGAGGDLTVRAGAAGTGVNNGGNLILQGGAKSSTGAEGSVIIRPQSDTTATSVFMIQNTAGTTTYLTADVTNGIIKIGTTGANAKLRVGDTTDGISFNDGVASKLAFRGTARPTIKVTLTPEFPGAVMTGDGTNNTGAMTSDFCSGSSHLSIPSASNPCAATEEHNYYSWSAQATNDYDIWTKWQIPSNFDAFDTTAITFYGWRTTSNTGDAVTLTLYDANGAVCGTATAISGTVSQWNNTTYTIGACSVAAGDVVFFRSTLSVGTSNNFARMGEITINYRAKF